MSGECFCDSLQHDPLRITRGANRARPRCLAVVCETRRHCGNNYADDGDDDGYDGGEGGGDYDDVVVVVVIGRRGGGGAYGRDDKGLQNKN